LSARFAATRRKPLFARAKAFLIPIRWPEPFGIVMVDSLACGTPVIAFPEGAASEIVIDGENGFLVVDQQAVADAIGSLTVINPAPLP
jgi:glycosyltransferase involved in cell wall biosynthesis